MTASVRKAFRVFVTVQSVLLAGIAIVGGLALAPGLDRLPQRIAGVSIALGLIAMFPIRTDALGARALFGWIGASRIGRSWVEAHRPFQFAASVLVLMVAAGVRLPAWLASAIPAAIAQLHEDVAREGLGATVVVWGVLALLGSLLLLLVIAFCAVTLIHALLPHVGAPTAAADAASTTILWNAFATIVLASAELPGLFTGETLGPSDWRWWVGLAISLALAQRIVVFLLLFGYDFLRLPLDAALAEKTLAVRITMPLTAIGLGVACAVYLALEPHLGVAAAAASIVIASRPTAYALERLSARAAVR